MPSKLVTMDMWHCNWTVVRDLLPQAQVVGDHWHVQRYANDGLKTVRNYYEYKESFKNIFY